MDEVGLLLLHGHRDLVLLLELGDGLVMLVLVLLESLNLCVASLDLLVDKLHTLAHVLAALLQLLTHQHRAVQFEDLEWDLKVMSPQYDFQMRFYRINACPGRTTSMGLG